jgi:hypothetical protein
MYINFHTTNAHILRYAKADLMHKTQMHIYINAYIRTYIHTYIHFYIWMIDPYITVSVMSFLITANDVLS